MMKRNFLKKIRHGKSDMKKLKEEKPLTGKWVFKIKQDGRYKARLVIRGCETRHRLSGNI